MNAEQIHRSSPKRPFGVSVIIFMLVLYALLMALIFAASLGANYGKDAVKSLDMESAPTGFVLLHYGIFPVFIIIELAIAIGLWRLLRWAWLLLMLQVGLSMLGDIWGYHQGQLTYPTMIIDVIIVFYLNQREIQRLFVSKGEQVIEWTS